MPPLATTLRLLAAHSPHGPLWWRYGHTPSLADALDNPDDYRVYSARNQARRQGQEAEYERRQRAREEERRRTEAGKEVCRPASGTCTPPTA